MRELPDIDPQVETEVLRVEEVAEEEVHAAGLHLGGMDQVDLGAEESTPVANEMHGSAQGTGSASNCPPRLHGPNSLEIIIIVKTATVADLRNNFRRVSAWLDNGETAEIVKRGQVIAQLVPVRRRPRKLAKPDIMARLEEQWGQRTFSLEEVRAMRSSELEGEQG